MQRKLLFIWFTHLSSPLCSTPRSFWADTSSVPSIRPKSMVLPAWIFNCSSIFLHIHVTKLKPWVFWDLRDLHHPSRFPWKLCLVRPPCSLASVPHTELHDCTESLLIAEPFPTLQDKIDTEIQRGGEILALWSQWEPKENVCIPSSSSSWLFTSMIPSSHTLHLWSWSYLGNTCMGLRSAAYRSLGGLLPPATRTMALLSSETWSSDMLYFRK